MNLLYNFSVLIAQYLLKFIALFNKKIDLFVEGRKQTFKVLQQNISKTDEVIWMHAASLGEFEQGRPIIEKLKAKFPTKKIVVTFFSPSGYEVRKNYNLANVVCYLPLDTKQNMKQFIKLLHPEIAILVKYEFWPNLLTQLQNDNIKTILVSGIFRENQPFFNWYGSFLRNKLKAFNHFFVQDPNSKKLLHSIGFNNVTVSGDTRFDRVFEITQQNNNLPFIEEFTNGKHLVVAGSTWEKDEEFLVKYINNKATSEEKFVIAPHNINNSDIIKLKKAINKPTVCFSEKENKNLKNYQVFIADTIGILTKIYSYANVAYVGGGFTKSGVHNTLEAATFNIPIIIGPNYNKFKEVKDLIADEACFSIDKYKKLYLLLEKFYSQPTLRKKAGEQALNYVVSNKGATEKILNYIAK